MFTLIVTALVLMPLCAANQAKPNVIFVLTDDLGFNAPGYINSRIISPTLDRLATEGLRLNRMYNYRYCSPTVRGAVLASLMCRGYSVVLSLLEGMVRLSYTGGSSGCDSGDDDRRVGEYSTNVGKGIRSTLRRRVPTLYLPLSRMVST